MLSRIALIQVGDIHYPKACLQNTIIDDKDARFPADLKTVLAGKPIKKVFQHIYASLPNVHGILFMGDFTDLGSFPGYKSCARYVARSLQIGSKGTLKDLHSGVIPGNHDVDREVAKASSNIADKFKSLSVALSEAGLPLLPLRTPDVSRISVDGFNVKIALLNSCWGCGSSEYIPEEFREGVARAIDEAIGAGKDEKAVRAYYERQFDTPAFSEETISHLSSLSAEDRELLVVCAHHNLMPQRQPRLAPYTELVNSGALRNVLSTLDRPVVYLHGHIHDDPIEIVSQPGSDSLVCVSVPLVSDGYNTLEFVFTKIGVPLSCNITKWRFNKSGVLNPSREMISLIGPRRRASSSSLAALYAKLLVAREMYWNEVISAAEGIFTSDKREQTVEALELLAADGRVKIENYPLSPENWIIGATV